MYDDLIFIAGGRFLMGDTSIDFALDSRPVHDVTLDDFRIGRCPVTQGLWADIMGAGPAPPPASDMPVSLASWFEAVEFCNRLSRARGLAPCYETAGGRTACRFRNSGFRLPTEAEWEYAAKGGPARDGFRYSGGDDIEAVAWYKGNSGTAVRPVGAKKPNACGLFDMSGNVWEWCWDYYGKYGPGPDDNPTGPETGDRRVYRGGSYLDFAYGCTVFVRGSRKPSLRQVDIGFRLAQTAGRADSFMK